MNAFILCLLARELKLDCTFHTTSIARSFNTVKLNLWPFFFLSIAFIYISVVLKHLKGVCSLPMYFILSCLNRSWLFLFRLFSILSFRTFFWIVILLHFTKKEMASLSVFPLFKISIILLAHRHCFNVAGLSGSHLYVTPEPYISYLFCIFISIFLLYYSCLKLYVYFVYSSGPH